MEYTYQPQGTCSREIAFELDGDIVRNVHFVGGCSGNLQAIAKLVDGQSIEQIKERCAGIRCGVKSTSCADQLVKALELAQERQKSQ